MTPTQEFILKMCAILGPVLVAYWRRPCPRESGRKFGRQGSRPD
jgi:hypothetical protein